MRGEEGWVERETEHAGRLIQSWLVFSNSADGELRGKSCAPYFADCPSDKIKSLEALGDVLSCPLANHIADRMCKSCGTHIHTC